MEDAVSAFARGTLLQTVSGPVAIEDLDPGEMVETVDGPPALVTWIGSTMMVPHAPGQSEEMTQLVRIMCDALGLGRPMPDLHDDLPQPPDERIGFAIVGLGAYALGQIIPNLSQARRARLAAVVSGNADKARTVARAYGLGDRHVYSYDTFDQIAVFYIDNV